MQTLTNEAVAAPGQLITITLTYLWIERDVAVFVPSSYMPGAPIPLVVALHGGSGDASVMYADDKRIVAHAESDGFIAVFPNGLPRPDNLDSHNYFWDDPINLGYMAFLLTELSDQYAIDAARIYFIGFSGGAQLIYELASDPHLSARIAGVGTVAGKIGGKRVQPADAAWEIIDPSVGRGCAMPAFLVQGAQDIHLPIDGGFDDQDESLLAGFETKVAIWRHFTGALTESEVPTPALPPNSMLREWTNVQTGHAVVALVDEQLGHHWPHWDLMGRFWSFFQRMPT